MVSSARPRLKVGQESLVDSSNQVAAAQVPGILSSRDSLDGNQVRGILLKWGYGGVGSSLPPPCLWVCVCLRSGFVHAWRWAYSSHSPPLLVFPAWTSKAIPRAFINALKVTLQSSKLVCLENDHAHHLPYVGGGRWKSHKHIIYRIYLLKLLLLSVRCLLMCNPNKRFPTVIRTLKQYKSTTYLVKHITLYLLYKHSWLLTLLLSNWTT